MKFQRIFSTISIHLIKILKQLFDSLDSEINKGFENHLDCNYDNFKKIFKKNA